MKEWAASNLFTKKVFYSNFVEVSNVNLESTILKGKVGKRIVCIAILKDLKIIWRYFVPSSITIVRSGMEYALCRQGFSG
jgi:hypothetical protein